MRLHSGLQPPERLAGARPRYPEVAQAAKVEGTVVLEATIDEQGHVTDVRVLRSIPLLDRAATDAVSTWRYSPTRLNGEPVSVIITVTVHFSLERIHFLPAAS